MESTGLKFSTHKKNKEAIAFKAVQELNTDYVFEKPGAAYFHYLARDVEEIDGSIQIVMSVHIFEKSGKSRSMKLYFQRATIVVNNDDFVVTLGELNKVKVNV